METVYEGWLKKKSQNEKKLFRPKTATQKSNQYWFVLKQSGDLPGQYILDYYTDSTCKKQKGRVDLDQCRKIDRKIDAIKPDEYLFSIETSKRTYNLLAQTKADLNKWIQCLCTVCGFKPNQPDAQLLLHDHQSRSMNGKPSNDIIIISYSNPNISIDSGPFNQSPTINLGNKSLTNNQSNNQLTNNQTNSQSKEKKLLSFDNVAMKWSNRSSTLNRTTLTKMTNTPANSSFSSATLPTKKSSISSAYIPISECHTGKSIFQTNNAFCGDDKKPANDDKFRVKFDVKFDDDENSTKRCINESNNENKENKFTNSFNKSLLDSSINSTHDLLVDINSRSPNLSNDDINYDVPRQVKVYKKSKIKDLLDVIPSPPAKAEVLYANAKSLPRNINKKNTNFNNLTTDESGTSYMNCSSSAQSNNDNLVNNYINAIELDRHASFRETVKEREYYNNVNEHPNSNSTLPPRPPPRPKSAKPISIPKYRSTSLNSLNDLNHDQTNLDEFDPLQQQPNNQLMSVPKAPSALATSPDLMYSIPKSQVELELEKRTKSTKNSLDTVVPLTHNLASNGKDELHRYTNAATDVFNKSADGHLIVYDYEKPSLPFNLNNLNNLNDNLDHQFKIPAFKLNDKTTEPITPSLIVTSTPLFSEQRHFNFNDQDDSIFKPQVNRDLKPKKSDTSIESIVLFTTSKSPNNRHSDTLINRTSLNSSFHKPSSPSTNTVLTVLNPPRIPSRGRQFGTKIPVTSNSNENVFLLINEDSKTVTNKRRSDYVEIQYLDLDLDCDNISLNSTMNETSINLNFKDTDLTNAGHLNATLNTTQANQLNNSFNAQSGLNYSHFVFSGKQPDNNPSSQLPSQLNTLNSSITQNVSTVYKTVDFIKTKAFNELKDELNR